MCAEPAWLRVARPGTAIAVCHVPFTSLTTNAFTCPRGSRGERNVPPALQLPGAGQEIALTPATEYRSTATVPGTLMASCQVPFASLTTNAPELYKPPAVQLPAPGHQTEF